jgi:large subunit ribosomal protein L9
MQVILLQDVREIGTKDTLVNVSDGHARNFLFPRKLAVIADASALLALEERKKNRAAQLEKEISAAREAAGKLSGKSVNIKVDVGENGKLFGSVTAHDISKHMHDELSLDIDKKKIVLSDPIKAVGAYNVQVKFGHEISATIKVNVSPSPK